MESISSIENGLIFLGCYNDNFLNLITDFLNVIMYLFYGLHKMYL